MMKGSGVKFRFISKLVNNFSVSEAWVYYWHFEVLDLSLSLNFTTKNIDKLGKEIVFLYYGYM